MRQRVASRWRRAVAGQCPSERCGDGFEGLLSSAELLSCSAEIHRHAAFLVWVGNRKTWLAVEIECSVLECFQCGWCHCATSGRITGKSTKKNLVAQSLIFDIENMQCTGDCTQSSCCPATGMPPRGTRAKRGRNAQETTTAAPSEVSTGLSQEVTAATSLHLLRSRISMREGHATHRCEPISASYPLGTPTFAPTLDLPVEFCRRRLPPRPFSLQAAKGSRRDLHLAGASLNPCQTTAPQRAAIQHC